VWQHGGVSPSPRGLAAGAGVGGGQEDALGVIFLWINETNYLQCLLLSLVCWIWDSIWMIVTLTLARCFSSLFFSLYTYTYTYTYCYYYCILYFLVLTKPAPAWVPVKASFSPSDTIVTLYRHQSTNRFVSLDDICGKYWSIFTTCQKNPFATLRTVLQRAKKSLCNGSQFWTLFLPHRFIKIRPSHQRPVSIEFLTICWIPGLRNYSWKKSELKGSSQNLSGTPIRPDKERSEPLGILRGTQRGNTYKMHRRSRQRTFCCSAYVHLRKGTMWRQSPGYVHSVYRRAARS